MPVNMNTFKISKKTNEVITTVRMDIEEIVTSGNDLCLIVKKENGLELNPGGKIRFEKYASGNSSSAETILVCEEDATIKTIVDSGDTRYVYFEYVYIKPLTLQAYVPIVQSPDEYKHKFYFTEDHHMLPRDIETGCGRDDYKIYVRRGDNVLEFSDLAFCYPYDFVKGEDVLVSGTCFEDSVTLFNYETMERNSILAKNMVTVGGSFVPEPGDQVLFCTNPYFHIEKESDEKYVAELFCGTYACKYTDFMGLGVVLEQDYDVKRMFQEYQVNDLFVKKIKNSVIPDFIDLEKVKYAPAFSSDTVYLATGLTFNLHFRERVSADTPYFFDNTWHLDDTTSGWNSAGYDLTEGKYTDPITRDKLYNDADFVNSSNLLGFLGFTDEDVYNQKNRVKQTFIRLSFYDSKDPLTQNLLYYSTIFLDSGDLYGKFVKRKAWLEEYWKDVLDDEYNPDEYPVVWSSGATTDTCSAVTCQMMVNDEYDMTKSGEGFNLYLFRDDAPIEKEWQDIYMKVEFNHAGIGRTVPLIWWEKDEHRVPKKLTMDKYLDNLYIRLRITFTKKGYVYMFPDAVQVKTKDDRKNGLLWENERLVFNLFEPMIESDAPQQ